MKAFAVLDYGLYVGAADIAAYAGTHDLDAHDMLFEIGHYYGGADGECSLIIKDEELLTYDDSFAILPLEIYPTLFRQAYKDKEAAINELKAKYAIYLPEDFDYEGKFVRFIGVVYG